MRTIKKQATLGERVSAREPVVVEKGQFYWVETDTAEFYLPCKLLYDAKDATQELTLEVYGTRAVFQAAQSAVAGLIPPPAHVTLEKNFNDLVAAVDISEPAILWNLKMRFQRNEIYSAIGPILIAVNPYKKIDNLYSAETLQRYLNVQGGDSMDALGRTDEEPHIWSIARSSYLQLRHSSTRQAIIVSGESGAGKTEATKQCLQFLSSISLSSDRHESRDAIEERVLDTNPLLESFGNAKTARNNNSSRFGKWLEIQFRRAGGAHEFHLELVGAKITQYLLEKSRVVAQAKDERNYHIFYQMCTHPEFQLGGAENFNFLCLSGATVIPGVNDAADFLETLKSFNDLKFSEEERSIVFDSLKAILYLGNVTFENGDQAKVPKSGDAFMALSEASSLLRMDLSSLEAALTERTLEVRGERMHVPNSESSASDDRNALCKEIYGRLFCQIVQQANASLAIGSSPVAHARIGAGTKMNGTDSLSIGLLDIFGFEIFVENSFEQLCINYANEKLQQYFIEFVLKKEQDVYDAEGIVFQRVTPMDNLDVLEMIESRQGGIFVLLDEELKVPKGNDLSFLKKVETQQSAKSSGRFRRDFRGPQELFEIKHFAGTVTYTVTNFMEKNRDKMHEHLEELLMSSASSRFRETMMTHRPGAGTEGKGKSPMSGTIVSRFSKQLMDLMGLLSASQPHFVKCVKPNSTKSANSLEIDLALRQLRYSGVLEAVKIRKSGWPVRMPHREFNRVYRVISGCKLHTFRGLDDERACQLIISQLAARNELFESVMLGRSLVFYRPEASNIMETERFDMAYKALIFLQAMRRMHISAARAKELSNARQLLRGAMSLGEQLSRCNTGAISMLEKEILACTNLSMVCFVLRRAKELLDRLRKVLACKERMQSLVDSHSSFTDIIHYHDSMKSCLNEAVEFGIKSPLITQAHSQLADIKERVDALLSLREAMQLQDDEILAKCMKTVAQLSKEHGTFCAIEVTHASQLFNEIRNQLEQLDESLKMIEAIQTTVDRNNSESCLGQVERDQPVLEDKLRSLLKHKPESAAGVAMTNIFQSIFTIRKNWIQKDWAAVAERMKQLRQECEAGVLHDPAKISSHNRSRVKAWQSAAIKEVDLIVVEMDVHYFLPKIMDVWVDTDGKYSNNSQSKEEADHERLLCTINEIKSIGWLGSNLTALFPLFDTALDLKKAHSLDEPEVILAMTEGEVTTRARLKRRNELVAVFNSEELMEDFSAIKIPPKVDKKVGRRTSIHFGDVMAVDEPAVPLAENVPAASRRHTVSDSRPGSTLPLILEESDEIDEALVPPRKTPVGLTGMFQAVDDSTEARPLPPPPRRYSMSGDVKPPPPPQPRAPVDGASSLPPPPPTAPKPPPPPAGAPPPRGSKVPPPPPSRGNERILPPPPPIRPSATNNPPESCISLPLDRNQLKPPVLDTSPRSVDGAGKKVTAVAKTIIPQYPPIDSDLLTHRKTSSEIDDIVNSLAGKFKVAAEVIRNDIARTRSMAMERYAHMLLTEAIQFGTIQGSGGKLKLEKGSIMGLSKTMKEVEDILKDKVYVDPLTEPIIEMSKCLIIMRKSILESSYESIVKMHSKGQLPLQPATSFMSRIQTIYFQMAVAEIEVIVAEASNEWFSRKLSSVLQVGAIKGDVGKIKKADIGYKEIEDVISMIQTSMAMRGAQGGLSDSLQQLIDFAEALINLRKAFLTDQFQLQKSAFEAFELVSAACPPIALKEVSFLKKNMLYGESLFQLTNCLTVPSNFSYFLSAQIPSSVEPEEDFQTKNKVNVAALATVELSRVVNLGDSVVMDVGVNSLPSYFQNLLKAARSILRLRESVVSNKWEDADDVLNFVRQKNLLTVVPLIQNEFHAAVEAVDAELVIAVCQNALASGCVTANAVEKSEFDISNVSTAKLDKAIDICLARGCRTKASTVLFKAANIVRDIRRAALASDWGTLKSIIVKVKQDKSVLEFPKYTVDEIMTAQIVITNEDLMNQIFSSLIKETIHLHYGKMPESKFVSTTGVKIALKEALAFSAEKRGRKLNILIDMAEHAVQCREGLKSGAWRTVLASSTGLFRSINNFKDVSESIEERNADAASDAKYSRRGSETKHDAKLVRRSSIGASVPHDLFAHSNFVTTMQGEYALLSDYITMSRVETDALQSLAENGLTEECVGVVQNAVISAKALIDVLEQLSKLQDSSALSLTKSLSNVAIAANLIKDIRLAVIEGSWRRVRELVNEAVLKDTFDILPDVSKKEVLAVKSELENKEMIDNLTAALAIGRLEGEVGQVNIETISFQALDLAIRECKSLVIKTEEGGCLMYSAMQILRLRQYILERPTPWGKLKVYTSGLLTGQHQSKLHPSTITEIRLLHSVVVDNVLCKSLTEALVNGNPSGPPGKMDCSQVSVRTLETACHEAVLAVNRTEKAEQLLCFCKQFISLRELLLHLDVSGSDQKTTWDTWSSIGTIVSDLVEISKKNPLDAGWLVCRSITISLSKEILIQECSSLLKESVDAACLTYSALGKMSFGTESSNSELSERIETQSLTSIVTHCTENAESTSLYLDQLLSATKSLKQVRELVNKREWAKVKKVTRNKDLLSLFQNCSFCMDEIQCAYQEAYNSEFIEAIEYVLSRPFKFSLSLSNEEVEEALLSENMLNDVNRRAESAGLNTVAALQLLECSERLLQLRFAVRNYDSVSVQKELRWFQANGHIPSRRIIYEVQLLERLFTNAMATKRIIDAISTGAAQRRNGILDNTLVNTEIMIDALDGARCITDPTDDLQVMMHIGELIYGLRYAQKYQDEDAVKVAVDNIMSSHIALHSSAVEEVSEARADVGNKAAVATLSKALKSFKPVGGMVPSSGDTGSILDDNADALSVIEGSQVKQQIGNKPRSPISATPRGGARKQSLSRQQSRGRDGGELNPSSAQALEIALDEAEHHGIFSVEAKRLKKTTLFVLSLRYAIEADDWFRVEEILAEHDKKSMTRRKSYVQLVDVASTEIQYVRLQLQVMSSLVVLGKNLKSGWANCSNGIVDVTRLIVEPLFVAICNTESSIFQFDEMKASSVRSHEDVNNFKAPSDGRVEKESVKRLLKSAHDIHKIRKHLAVGEITAAASLAEKVLQAKPHAIVHAELQLYYVEIGRALHMMRLCRSLRGSMRLGNVEALEATIFEAQQASMQLSGDLGLVRTLEKALELYRSIIEAHSYLRSVAEGYDIKRIENALEQSMKLNMSGALVDRVKIRLNVLKRFEANVKVLTASITSKTNLVHIQEVVSQLSATSALDGHPIARRAATLLRLSRDSMRSALLAEALFSGNCRLACCETLFVRKYYLSRKNLGNTFSMTKFSGFRDTDNFATRMMLDAQELRASMLHHSEGHIATSLTKLSPALAALAVWIFRHCIRAIEEQEYSHPEVILRNLISLGRFSIPMRDEILAQIIKQLTGNPEEGNTNRLWLMLAACLEHFPPSMEFETFVEYFLFTESSSVTQSDTPILASHCLAALHESVFRHGYGRRIISSWDASLKHMLSLLSLNSKLSSVSSDNSAQYTAVVQEALGRNTRRRSIATGMTRQSTSESVDNAPSTTEKVSRKMLLQGSSDDSSWNDGHISSSKLVEAPSTGKKSRRMSSIESFSVNSFIDNTPKGIPRENSYDFADKDDDHVARGISFSINSFTNSVHDNKEMDEIDFDMIILDKKIRGTVENWKARFHLLSDSKVFISYQSFLLKFRNNMLDYKDKDIFSFLIFGVVPKSKLFKTHADKFHILNEENMDPEMSSTRQSLIMKYCGTIDVARRDLTYEASVLRFWNKFVLPFLDDDTEPFGTQWGEDNDNFCESGEISAVQHGKFDYLLYRDLIISGVTYLLDKKL